MGAEGVRDNKTDIGRGGMPHSSAAPVTSVLRRPSRLRLTVAALGILLLIAGLLLAGILPRLRRQKELQAAAQAVVNAVPTVGVVAARESLDTGGLELPGNVEAIQTTTISARTSGYLRRWYVDIGDRVKTGQLLAEIDTPEVAQELHQARATLEQSRAALAQSEANLQQARTNMELARITYERFNYLYIKGVVDRQTADQDKASLDANIATVNAMVAAINSSKANINANEANVKRLTDLLGYNKVYAPFDGIITARFVDVGSLIGTSGAPSTNAATTPSPLPVSVNPASGMPLGTTASGVGGTSANNAAGSVSGAALFSVARIDSLRIYINLPQTYMSSIQVGMPAAITIKELPQKTFHGTVARTSSALDSSSRTLLTEVRLNNPQRELLPGMYAVLNVSASLPQARLRIPSSAVIVRADGPQVAVVTSDHKVHLKKVVLGRDYGTEVEVTDGLTAGEEVIVTITDDVTEGRLVNPMLAGSPGS